MEGYQNVLCATDFSNYGEVAAERAADMAQRDGAQLTLLHVVEYFPEVSSNQVITPGGRDPVAYREEIARESLAELAGHLGYEKVVQEVRFSTHSAKDEIVRFAEEENIDLIVVASHGHHGLSCILGSTAYGVTHNAPCDVLAVRARG